MNLNFYKTLLRKNNFSELSLFGRQLNKVRPEHWFTLCLLVQESEKYPFEDFKKNKSLKKGQEWRKEYTLFLIEKIKLTHQRFFQTTENGGLENEKR
jgi:hypothetical protein